jgi:hypothetical protein
MTQSPVSPNNSSNLDQWQPYELDHHAQELVLKNRDKKDVLNETHKMRMTVAYGLERFWGERFRLERESTDKANYWKDVWSVTVKILQSSGIILPNDNITDIRDGKKIEEMAKKLWKMDSEDRQISLMVLTQFCDSLVWWSQRLKTKNNEN